MSKLTAIVDEINKILKDGEPGDIQEDRHRENKDDPKKSFIVYGYYPYEVFRAVNQVAGPENLLTAVLSEDHNEKVAWCTVRACIRAEKEWICREHAGGSPIVKGNIGDAKKGAITDATQKALSMFGVAYRAYRGLLKEVYLAEKPKSIQGREPTTTRAGGGRAKDQLTPHIGAAANRLKVEGQVVADKLKEWLLEKHKVGSTTDIDAHTKKSEIIGDAIEWLANLTAPF